MWIIVDEERAEKAWQWRLDHLSHHTTRDRQSSAPRLPVQAPGARSRLGWSALATRLGIGALDWRESIPFAPARLRRARRQFSNGDNNITVEKKGSYCCVSAVCW
jgi:hypothetical protein